MNTKILIIEDDHKILNFISMALKAKEYQVVLCKNGKEGILSFCTQNPDIILLDLGLPDMDGIHIIKQIREVSEDIPIIVVSARKEENEKIQTLDMGANDYVTKPFSMGELLARIRVMERLIEKKSCTVKESIYHFDSLTVDTEKHRVFVDKREVHLTPIEYKLLLFLISNKGKVLTHNQISKKIWGYEQSEDAKNIRVFMASLRKKIEKDPTHPRFILTEIGVGYRFSDQ
ncbi:response regulator [Garciella nitratireducens]|uniref:Stage 0 sporulation protein A homolog n=1 Tax=Garciella nitratireducens DSM 15102 TaxID=1121911 RepID=A0A1T4MAP9_9FIRM|nr:response regulator transcription factor [Garciella nitratireducens]SJZ64022.1 two-component system, OmpR family, KDP operon response regulator KdpE [Garciella nitratireducens DSM 15102]